MSIAPLFFDSQSVSSAGCLPAEREFHVSELRRLTGLECVLQRELNGCGGGLVRSERSQPARFRQTRKSRLWRTGRPDAKTFGVEPMLRAALLPLVPDLQAACVYGSVAKQTDTAQSDIRRDADRKNLRSPGIGIAAAAGSTTRPQDPIRPVTRAPNSSVVAPNPTRCHRVLAQPILCWLEIP